MRSRARQAVAKARSVIESAEAAREGYRYARGLPLTPGGEPVVEPEEASPLEVYFDGVTHGPGIWKWRHYFPAYHRHLAKFIGREVHIAEIGIYSGGSLPMWRSYFGPGCQVYGIDIEPACRAYESDGVRIFIGDQADPAFWGAFVRDVPRIDVVIDDGGHEAYQQIASLKALLPHMAMGGVYICEDIHGPLQPFHSFVDGLTRPLSDVWAHTGAPSAAHRHIASVHRYPLLTVIEKPAAEMPDFESPRHGTRWQPFLDGVASAFSSRATTE